MVRASSVMRVVILTGGHLCHNPRTMKEATTLSGAGYAVEVLGAWFDPILRARDRELQAKLPFTFTPVVDLTQDRIVRLGRRIRTRLGQWAFKTAGYENRSQFGYAAADLDRAARQRCADLYIAHSEVAIAVANRLRRNRARVGIDMEDWFSEDLTSEARKSRPLRLLQHLERDLLCHAAHSTCPSHVMSEALATEFGCRPPTVIYNAFPWSDRSGLRSASTDRRTRTVPSIHWFSQTLGAGRGLEDLFAALPWVAHEAEIHLRGNPASGFMEWAANRIPPSWRNRVFVHGLVPNGELLGCIADHDVGFAGEMMYARNKDLTVSNKLLHFLLAGLAVVASDTSGQQEVARQAPGAVLLYCSGDATALADRLNVLFASTEMCATPRPRRSMQPNGYFAGSGRKTSCWKAWRARWPNPCRACTNDELEGQCPCVDRPSHRQAARMGASGSPVCPARGVSGPSGASLAPRRGGFHRAARDTPRMAPHAVRHVRARGARDLPRILRPGSVALDVGANVGWHTLLMARLVGESGRVLAVEANPSVRARLVEHLRLNRMLHVEVVPYALADAEGSVEFQAPDASDPAAGEGHVVRASETPRHDVLRVEARTLDSLLEPMHVERLDLMKIDVEGFEWPVLKGAERAIARFRPHIVFEYIDEYADRGSGAPQVLADFFAQHGYCLFTIGRRGAEAVVAGQWPSAANLWAMPLPSPEDGVPRT